MCADKERKSHTFVRPKQFKKAYRAKNRQIRKLLT